VDAHRFDADSNADPDYDFLFDADLVPDPAYKF
jgi:hypothetical protein